MSAAPRRPADVTGHWSVWQYNWLANAALVRAIERTVPHARGELLDMGCGRKPFARLFAGRVSRYWGTDLSVSPYLDGARLDAFARAEAQPFRDGTFDTVVGFSMLTYLPEPLRMLEEAHRVLRPGGVLVLEFTQMVPLHDEPHDYFRFTRYGADWLLRQAGFEPMDVIPVGGIWARLGLSLIAGLNRINRGPTRVLTEIPVRLAYVGIQSVCALLDAVFPNPREVLAHVVVARRNP